MDSFKVYWNSYDKHNDNYLVGLLSHDENWHFSYPDDVIQAIGCGFRPFPDMPDIAKTYTSKELFPVFSSRYGNPNGNIIMRMEVSDARLVTDKIRIKSLEKRQNNGKN